MNRRDFLKDTAAATMALGLGMGVVEELHAQQARPAEEAPAGPPISCAVIGLGQQGRDMLTSLAGQL